MLSEVGFEPTPAYADQNTLNSQQCKQGITLESGALDHSAILKSEILIRYNRLLWDHVGINTLLLFYALPTQSLTYSFSNPYHHPLKYVQLEILLGSVICLEGRLQTKIIMPLNETISIYCFIICRN